MIRRVSHRRRLTLAEDELRSCYERIHILSEQVGHVEHMIKEKDAEIKGLKQIIVRQTLQWDEATRLVEDYLRDVLLIPEEDLAVPARDIIQIVQNEFKREGF